jgi:hypothetical protein
MDSVAYIAIPAGNFVLADGVTAHPFEVLAGLPQLQLTSLGGPLVHHRRPGSVCRNISGWLIYLYRRQPTLVFSSARGPQQETHSPPVTVLQRRQVCVHRRRLRRQRIDVCHRWP